MILITGSNGMIGTALCQRLLAEKVSFIGIDKVDNQWDQQLNQHTLNLDLTTDKWYDKVPKNISTIIHLAASSRVNTAVEDPNEFLNNIQSLFSVLEFARSQKVQQIIFSSSKEVYGYQPNQRLSEEYLDLTKCENPYSASKIAGEAMIHSYKNCYELDSVILRFSNVYGKYDLSTRVIPLFIKRALENKNLIVYGQEKKLDFVYLEDVVSGIITSLRQFEKIKNNTYNIAYGRSYSLVRLADQINNYLGKKLDVVVKPNRVGEIMQYQANITKAEKDFAFKPKYTLAEGLASTIAWHQTLDSTIATL